MDDIVKSGHPAVISTLVMGVLATVATSLRFLAKLETKAGLAADDYWIMISLATYWAYTAVTLWAVFKGGGGMDMPNIVKGDVTGITIYIQVRSLNKKKRHQSLTEISVLDHQRVFVHYIANRRQTGNCILLPSDFFSASLGQTVYVRRGDHFDLLVVDHGVWHDIFLRSAEKILGTGCARSLHELRHFLFNYGHCGSGAGCDPAVPSHLGYVSSAIAAETAVVFGLDLSPRRIVSHFSSRSPSVC